MTIVTIDLDRIDHDLDRLQRERDDIDLELSKLTAIRAAAVAYGVPANGHATKSGPSPTIVARAEVADKAVYEAAATILRKVGRPMKTAEIKDALHAAGYGTRVKNFQTALFTAMNRKREMFEKPSPGVWRLIQVET